MVLRAFLVLAFSVSVVTATAQTLTPEQIEAMVNERVDAQNPYQALLNDPDPERSLAAMRIMLESGDAELARMALEFGLLSPNPTVRRTAVEAFLTTQPVLSLRFQGDLEWSNYATIVHRNYSGTTTPDGVGFWRMPVGPYSPKGRCFLRTNAREETCLVTVNADGVFISASELTARLEVDEVGQLAGFGTLNAVSETPAISIRLLD